MLKKCFAIFLVLACLFQLAPFAGAARASNGIEEGTDAFSGTPSQTTDLLFDFSNNDAAKTRYKSAAYGGYNFDQESNGYWATGYNGSTSAYSISNSNGTLRLSVTEGADANGTYGPWLKVTNTYGKAPSYGSGTYQYYPLNYNPSQAKFIQIRFKLTNCTVPSGKVPRIVFEHYFTKDGVYSYSNTIRGEFTFQNGVYQTVTIPVNSTFTGADAIKGFGFRFQNIKSTGGTMYVDYIYIGASGSLVMPSSSTGTTISQNVTSIASGVAETEIFMKNRDATPVAGFIATISPTANVTFKASYGNYYSDGSTVASRAKASKNLAWSGATTTAQAAAYETATGEEVLFAVNADFFDMSTFQPRGSLIMEGNVLQTYGTRKTPYFAVLKDGSYAIRPYGSYFGDVQEAVSGYQWLVRNGALVSNNDVERHPRTAIGLKKDGTVVVFATDGRQEGYSMGMTLHELANAMFAAGCVDAINLDGGGSTTFATAYSGTTDLKIRNKPCDSTGERVVASTLLLVATECKHKYTNGKYSLGDGTHTIACDTCGTKATVPHKYNNGQCICGAVEDTVPGLFFGFNNGAEDLNRYNNAAYGYYNYDLPSNGKWANGYWATGYNGSTDAYTIDNGAGALTVNVTDNFSGSAETGNVIYGPWLKISDSYGQAPSKTVTNIYPLNYNPKDVDHVQIRFKLTNCTVPSGKTPRVVFEYYYMKDGSYQASTDMMETYSFQDGTYLTVTLPASAALKNADALCGFGFRFQNIMSTSGGKLAVDYIYIGEKSADSLYFDFKNDSAAKEKYNNVAYNFYNFDTASNGHWTTTYNGSYTAFSINNAEGVLNLTVTDGYSSSADNSNIIYGPWLKLTDTYGKFTGKSTYDYYPLSYDPSQAEYIQVRLKHNNCVAAEGKTPRLVLESYHMKDGVNASITDMMKTYTFTDGVYQTLTFPVSATFKSADEIKCFGLRFQHILSSGSGSVTIDYIYIGPLEKLPEGACKITFCNEDGTVLETKTVLSGSNVTYSGETPQKAADENGHYQFVGWGASLENVTSDMSLTAQFSSEAHGFDYEKMDGENHKASCTCGYSKEIAHCWGEGTVSVEAKCTENGQLSFTCNDCGEVKIEMIDALGHAEVVDAEIPSTCTQTGWTEGKHCSVCGETIVKQEVIPALGHRYTPVVIAPSCTESGYTVYVCECGHNYADEKVDPTGHNYTKKTTAPTCTEAGNTLYTCTACGDSYTEPLAALGHSFAYTDNGENHTVTCENTCGYKATESHGYAEGTCICGATEITAPILDANLTFGAQLYLENDLTMAFRVKADKLSKYDISTAYLVVEREVYETGAKEATVVTTSITEATLSADNRYVFSYPGIAAAQMNDAITATLHIKDANGQEYLSPVLNTSVATYLDGLLTNSASDTKLVTLIMDMVNYGTAAQVFFDRHADSLVNEAFESFKTYASYASADFTSVLEDLSATENADGKAGKLNIGLDLGTRIGIQYKVTLPAGIAAEDVSLVIADANGNTLETLTLTGEDVTMDSKGRYIVNFYGSTSKDMRRVVYATAYANGEAITGTYAYSISTYAWGVQENASAMTPELVALTRAMMLYGDSAQAYFG